MRKSPNFLLMFYTNWCGFCKRIKPFFSEVASEMKGKHVLAAMDMDKNENSPARQIFNISGFPTILYFENAFPKYTFEGENTKDGLVKFLENPSEPPIRVKEEEWAEDENSEIVHLTSSNFDIILREEKAAIVVFHAAFCGHCKALKPKYEAAAVMMKNKGISGMLAAVDAQKENELGSKYGIKGFPTLKFFEFGEFKFDVNLRETDPIVKFMEHPDEPPVVEVEPEISWEDEENEVVFLNEETFKPFLKKTKHVLTIFYTPWCGHCKHTKPEFVKAAEEFKDDSKVAFAAVDCTKHSAVCSAYEVRGYPTIKYFNYMKASREYSGGRVADDFIKFMRDPDAEPEKPKVETTPFTSDKVVILEEKTFDVTLKKHSSALVFFGQEWCGWCKRLKPIYSEAAELLSERGISGTLAAIDCGSAGTLCSKFDITGYPSVKYFQKGKFVSNYNGERTSEAILEFLKANSVRDEL
jgi:protein disulfide-isomerase-like protein